MQPRIRHGDRPASVAATHLPDKPRRMRLHRPPADQRDEEGEEDPQITREIDILKAALRGSSPPWQ